MQTVTPEQQPEWNRIIVGVLRAFDDFCRKHQLIYFCGGGTAIGAVRHQGIIPWDDDIDVFMPRPDYDRLLQLASRPQSGESEGALGDYELLTPFNCKDYPYYFSKLCDRRTTLVEEADKPCITGLYIDIFPLDGAASSRPEAIRQKRRFRKIQNRLEAICTRNSFGAYLSLLTQRKEWGRFVVKTAGFLARPLVRRWLLGQMERMCRRYDYATSELVVVYCGVYDDREIYPRSWASSQVWMPFEGMQVPLSNGYDLYLRQFFGDYMQLPPVEKRVSHHQKAFFCLTHRCTQEEVRAALKQ